jgi:hypothetical protein
MNLSNKYIGNRSKEILCGNIRGNIKGDKKVNICVYWIEKSGICQ